MGKLGTNTPAYYKNSKKYDIKSILLLAKESTCLGYLE
jgi:hypothetical protein